MLDLPRFTFLCGEWGQGQGELIREIVFEDDNILRLDFTAPIHDMISNLFPDSLPVTLDPLEHLDKGVLGYDPELAPCDEFMRLSRVRIRDLLENLVAGLRVTFGPQALGLLALRTYHQHNTAQIFERVIFSDANDPADAEVFVNQFGGENCLAIHLGPLFLNPSTSLKCKHTWLPMRETKLRMEFLRKDLSNATRPAK